MIQITFKNKTTQIDRVIVEIDDKKWEFTGDKAKELAKMANNDYPSIKKFIENLMNHDNLH